MRARRWPGSQRARDAAFPQHSQCVMASRKRKRDREIHEEPSNSGVNIGICGTPEVAVRAWSRPTMSRLRSCPTSSATPMASWTMTRTTPARPGRYASRSRPRRTRSGHAMRMTSSTGRTSTGATQGQHPKLDELNRKMRAEISEIERRYYLQEAHQLEPPTKASPRPGTSSCPVRTNRTHGRQESMQDFGRISGGEVPAR